MKKVVLLLGAFVIPGCFDTSTRPGGGTVARVVQTPAGATVEIETAPVVRPVTNADTNAEEVQSTPGATSTEFGTAAAKAHPDEAKAMLAAAQKAVEATKASYDVGTTTLGNLHH